MRIISGIHKGRRIQAPKNLPVRPTTDMSKESLFNILRNQVDFTDLKILDLFSGTGNISYEFASRGATQITAIDADFGCVKFIKKTAEMLQMPIEVYKNDVFKFLAQHQVVYDLIFADPPYDLSQELFENIPALIFEKALLNPDGILIVEHSKHTDLSKRPYFSFQKNYGGSTFSFFEWEIDSKEDGEEE